MAILPLTDVVAKLGTMLETALMLVIVVAVDGSKPNGLSFLMSYRQ